MENDNLEKKNRSIFSGRPALAALAPYIFGIIFSTIAVISYLIPLSLTIIALIITIYYYSVGKLKISGRWTLILIFCLGWFGAGLRSNPTEPNHIGNLAASGGKVELFGKVVDEPDIREDKTYLVIDTDSVKTGRYMIPSFGRIRARVNDGGSCYNHADYLMISGYLYKPGGPRNPLGFDYGAYLRTKNIHAGLSVKSPMNVSILKKGNTFLGSVISPLRQYLLAVTRKHLSPVSSAILSGFILGERRDIPEEYQTMFKNTGTLHLMAVSGSNVGMVLVIFAYPMMLLRIRRGFRVTMLIGVIFMFALLTRLEPSVVRATIMATVGLLAYGWIRKPDYVNVIAFAGLMMLLWNPIQVFDVGLQLSFAATFSIVYFLPRPLSWLSRRRWARLAFVRWLMALSITTLAAQVAVTPLMARYFNNIPSVGLVANIPIGLLAAISTTGGIIFYAVSLLGDWAAALLAVPLEWSLELVKILLKLFSSFPAANIKIASPSWFEITLFWVFSYIAYEAVFNRRISRIGVLVFLALFASSIWSGLLERKPAWRIDYIDIGKNKGWIFTDDSGSVLSSFDFYDERYDPNRVIIPHVMNTTNGEIDYLLTSTPDLATLEEIKILFSPKEISIDSLFQRSGSEGITFDVSKNCIFMEGLPGNAKVVLGKSDNNRDAVPLSLILETRKGVMIFSTGADLNDLVAVLNGREVTLLELPWSAYAQESSLETIRELNPAFVVFSPDRYSAALPFSREELTHSNNLILATSICGGFSVAEINGVIKVRTMKGFGEERDHE